MLAEEIAAVGAFTELLQKEAAVLRAGDTDELARVTASKEVAATQLEDIGRRRQAFFAGLDWQKAGGVEDWLSRQQSPRLLALWRELLELAEAARASNLENGRCIALLARNVRERLSAIMGRPDGEDVYHAPSDRSVSPFSSSSISPVTPGARIRNTV